MSSLTNIVKTNAGKNCSNISKHGATLWGEKKKEATQTSENKMVNIRLHKFRLLHTVLLNQLQEDYNI